MSGIEGDRHSPAGSGYRIHGPLREIAVGAVRTL